MENQILNELTKPDRRWQYFNVALSDLKSTLEEIKLSDNVPKEIHGQIDICKKLCLYSYFVYEFATVAMERSYLTIETALKIRYEMSGSKEIKSRPTLGNLINWAKREKIFLEEFPGIAVAIKALRNIYAHPKRQQINTPSDSIWHVKNNVEIINSIFNRIKNERR